MATAARNAAHVTGTRARPHRALSPARTADASAQKVVAAGMPRYLQGRAVHGAPSDSGETTVHGARVPRYLQAELEISQPGDVYEQEAQRMAHEVLRMPDVIGQQPCTAYSAGEPGVHGTPVPAGTIQRNANATANVPGASASASRPGPVGRGEPLDPATRGYFEPRFAHDFSEVRVHASAAAAQSARELNAHAYTVGQDVVFGEGRYAPSAPSGRELLAHELAHVVQQSKTFLTVLQRQVDPSETRSTAPSVPYFVDFDINSGWNADQVLGNLQLLTPVPQELAAAIQGGPGRTAGYCAKLLGIVKAKAASHDSSDVKIEEISRALFSRWNELYHATRNSPLRYMDFAQVAAWAEQFSTPEPKQSVASTDSEPLVQVPTQDTVDWNKQYAAAYKKKRPKGDTAEKDFQTERMSGKVQRASSIAGTKVTTQLSSDQVQRIVVAGGEKASAERCAAMADKISEAFETMLIDTAQAQADFLAHLAGETGGVLEELEGDKRSYAPFQGRGAIQITGPEIYAKALGTMQQRRDQIAAQMASSAAKVEANSLRQQLIQLDEAINAVRADPKAAADPKYGFLLSAANMHKTGAVSATSRLGATAVFAGNGPADTWVSGGNNGMTFDERKAQNETELVDWEKNLAAEKQRLASETDTEAAKLSEEKIKQLQDGVDARKRLIRDMTSAKSRARIKAAVYAAGVRILSAENSLDTAPKVGS